MGAPFKFTLGVLIEWALTFTFWMLLISKWEASEARVGVLATFIAVTGIRVVASQSRILRRPRWSLFPMLLQAWRLPGYAVSGTIEILKALARECFRRHGAESLLRAVEYHATHPESSEDQFSRVLAITYSCATPNFVVLGVDCEHGYLLYHQVWRASVRAVTQNLGAFR